MVTSHTGFPVGSGGILLKTTDGEFSWNMLKLTVNSRMNDLFFTDTLNGVLAGENGKAFITADGVRHLYCIFNRHHHNRYPHFHY